ncbi:MAG: hypothetical protein ACT4NP_20020 [Pseudonocardiales bacterium]
MSRLGAGWAASSSSYGELASWRVSSELDAVARRLAHYPEVPGFDRFLARRGAMSI